MIEDSKATVISIEMIRFPKAKINIGLNVVSKREDGYHNIESIFYPIPLCDVLELIPTEKTGELSLQTVGIELPNDGVENLCSKAYRILKNDFELPSIDAALLKNIPSGAGLGGGSSDGAEMLKMLNEIATLNLSDKKLTEYAMMLGSDCPFFIQDKTAFVHGRGENMKEIIVDLEGLYFVIINPGIHVPTSVAYSKIKVKKPEFDLREIGKLQITDWKNKIRNDFEDSIFSTHSSISEIKSELYTSGALYASMTGSGSSVYGLFENELDLREKFNKYFVFQSWL